MIDKLRAKCFCSEDISLIENYNEAIASEEGWDIHHRGEILPCGRYSRDDLKKFGLYYNRPACELIFLLHSDHTRLHTRGKSPWNKGKHLSEDTKKKLHDLNVGRPRDIHTKSKISNTLKGNCYWFNNGVVCVRAKKCPEGFTLGMLKRPSKPLS